MKRPTNVRKFKVVAALVAVLVVGAIGYTAWFVSHSDKVASDAYAKSNKSYTVKPVKKVAATQAQQYLTIKEWGVKISIDDPALNDAIYKVQKRTTSGIESVALETKNTVGMDFTCGGEGTGEPITHMKSDAQAALLRAKTPAILSTGSNRAQSAFTHIGSYYYVYQNSPGYGPCGITDSKLAALAGAAGKAFAAASIVAE